MSDAVQRQRGQQDGYSQQHSGDTASAQQQTDGQPGCSAEQGDDAGYHGSGFNLDIREVQD
ncbi:hypothetical protein D3C71_1740650 [compost metagenome]